VKSIREIISKVTTSVLLVKIRDTAVNRLMNRQDAQHYSSFLSFVRWFIFF